MDDKIKVKRELKLQLYEKIEEVNKALNGMLRNSDINSVLIDMLHENNQHDPREAFKK